MDSSTRRKADFTLLPVGRTRQTIRTVSDRPAQALRRNDQHRILAAEGVLDILLRVRVGQPLPIDHKQIFVATGLNREVSYPSAITDLSQGSPFRLPIVSE